MSRQNNNNSPVPQEADLGVIQNINIVNNNNAVAVAGNGGGETESHAYSAE